MTALKKFQQVKNKRRDLFRAMFDHVSSAIEGVYQDLTRSTKHQLGGNAYLTLDDEEEPYLGGINYTAMPPSKRYRVIKQLSGGEKTIAALALLFAIHRYHPSPFFVLDEIDAALDNINMNKVSSYIQSRREDFQSIVISLKENFNMKADGLIGIYRDKGKDCSLTCAVDLTPYEE